MLLTGLRLNICAMQAWPFILCLSEQYSLPGQFVTKLKEAESVLSPFRIQFEPYPCRVAGLCWKQAAPFTFPMLQCAAARRDALTCRVRVTAGEKFCPPPKEPELATLHQIQATRDIRLGCQLRPRGSISVVPLVQIEQRNYRPITPRRSTEREIACLYCDFLNRPSLAENNLPKTCSMHLRVTSRP